MLNRVNGVIGGPKSIKKNKKIDVPKIEKIAKVETPPQVTTINLSTEEEVVVVPEEVIVEVPKVEEDLIEDKTFYKKKKKRQVEEEVTEVSQPEESTDPLSFLKQ